MTDDPQFTTTTVTTTTSERFSTSSNACLFFSYGGAERLLARIVLLRGGRRAKVLRLLSVGICSRSSRGRFVQNVHAGSNDRTTHHGRVSTEEASVGLLIAGILSLSVQWRGATYRIPASSRALICVLSYIEERRA